MLISSQPMSLEEMDKNEFLRQTHSSLERVRFALESHNNFKQFIRIEIDNAINHIEKNINIYNFDLTEDQITSILIGKIENKHLGINAYHEDFQRGHCDITIKLYKFTWHGEAKKHTSGYKYLLKGYAQLTERYTNGNPDSCSGGLIIYSQNSDCKKMMTAWYEYLQKWAPEIHKAGQAKLVFCKNNPLVFYSTHQHTVSGLPYEVTHFAVNFHFDPVDRKL
ncbi:hypothetical protein HGT71_14355 [Rosenbergiella epipactidis]|uniref:hypothetical protein n=1 Tax=Rosenbergiella epipactidis TaxID=1544694 RepID=UPI001BDAE356|nr:hypothetical protein [Rosenbergiella epipactidis]MBT0719428.1 hypothetical protein [Rosenbergiella epipactidis]